MAFNVEYVYEILDRYSGPLQRITAQTRKFRAQAQKVQRSLRKASAGMEAFGNKASSMQGAMAALGGAAAFGLVVNRAVQVEDALQDLVRVGDLTEKQLAMVEGSMEDLSEQLGADKVGLLEQAFAGLKLGIPTEEISKFVELSSRTAIAFDIMDQEAGRSLGSLRAKLGLTTDELGTLLDSVNFVADNFAADGGRMIEIVERTSGTMKTLEFPPEVVAGLAGFADQVEVTAQLAASGLNQIFARMQKNPKLVKQLMQDPVAALTAQFEHFQKIDPAKRFAVIERKFGLEAARFMSKAVGNIDLFTKTMDAAASDRAFGSMLRELENRTARTSTILAILGKVASNIFEEIGEIIKPAVRGLAQFAIKAAQAFKEFIRAHPGLVRFGAVILSLTTVFVALAGAAGVLSLALAPIVAAMGAISLPMVAIAAGVGAVAAAFTYWTATSHPLIAALGDIWRDVKAILAPFGALLEYFDLGQTAAGIFTGAMQGLGDVIGLLLVPLRVALKTMAALVEASTAVAQGDFSGAGAVLLRRLGDIKNIFSETGSAGAAVEEQAVNRTARLQGANNTVSMNGQIQVSAAPGSKVESAEIGLDGGASMAYAQ